MDIKAIDTVYKGYRFRSRLEARWAVFFDSLGVEFEYEKEGYEFECGIKYLPDFWIPLHEETCAGNFIEIKATKPTKEEVLKLTLLSKNTKRDCFCFWDMGIDTWSASVYIAKAGGWEFIPDGLYISKYSMIYQDNVYSELNGSFNNLFHYLPFGYKFLTIPDSNKAYKIKDALLQARKARFEFGEN